MTVSALRHGMRKRTKTLLSSHENGLVLEERFPAKRLFGLGDKFRGGGGGGGGANDHSPHFGNNGANNGDNDHGNDGNRHITHGAGNSNNGNHGGNPQNNPPSQPNKNPFIHRPFPDKAPPGNSGGNGGNNGGGSSNNGDNPGSNGSSSGNSGGSPGNRGDNPGGSPENRGDNPGNNSGNAGGNPGNNSGSSGDNPGNDGNSSNAGPSSSSSSNSNGPENANPSSSTTNDSSNSKNDGIAQSQVTSSPDSIDGSTALSGASPTVTAAIVSNDGTATSGNNNPFTTGSNTTASPVSPEPQADLGRSPNRGAIAGGVLGGLFFIALFVTLATLYYRRRRRNRLAPSAEYLSNSASYPFARAGLGNMSSYVVGGDSGKNTHYGGAGKSSLFGNRFFRRHPNIDVDEEVLSDGKAMTMTDGKSFSTTFEVQSTLASQRETQIHTEWGEHQQPQMAEVLYSTPTPMASFPISNTGNSSVLSPVRSPTSGSPAGRRIPFGTGTFEFPPRNKPPPSSSQPLPE